MTDPALRHSRCSGGSFPAPFALLAAPSFIYLSYLFISLSPLPPRGPGRARSPLPVPSPPRRPRAGLGLCADKSGSAGSPVWRGCHTAPGAVTPLPALPCLPLLVFTSPCSGITHPQPRTDDGCGVRGSGLMSLFQPGLGSSRRI